MNQRGKRGASSHYALMPLDRIKAMPVADLCEENAHLYLWISPTRVTSPALSLASISKAHMCLATG
ncbi:hypothetical protein [Romboutsia ilealis]|uniref:hypothetical protein n=1 Tax=Romboutsia ilealis TaxID=1115758 RepID=UPI00272A0426|nr:hypothetical protein [Romboutsia ilealis]